MILKKRLQDGKTIYEPISFEEAVEQRAEKSDFVFTDEDEKTNSRMLSKNSMISKKKSKMKKMKKTNRRIKPHCRGIL